MRNKNISMSSFKSSRDIQKKEGGPENQLFAYAKTKTQISFAVATKLISAFVFATLILQSLYYQNPESQASRHLLWLYSLVCV